MPELPDVEGFRRALARTLPRREVRSVRVLDPGILRDATPSGIGRRLHGRTFGTPRRHGKWLILPTEGPRLLVHSGMTGHPYYRGRGTPSERFDRLVIELDRGELRYADLRKLRGVWVADDDGDVGRIIGPIGPDALGLDLTGFRGALAGRGRVLKPALTDQTVIAGLGNLLADEICWQARIAPSTLTSRLDDSATATLHRTMRRVLRTSVRHACVPSLRGWLTAVRNDRDAECPRCGAPLSRGRTQGRATVWCPREQSAG